MNQKEVSKINKQSWSQFAYQAWTNRHGTPKEYAKVLQDNPYEKVAHYLTFMGDVKGKKIINLLGSKGNKAVSFALLGANVTVVDISEGNRKYADELAEEANVSIDYIVSDVLELPENVAYGEFDYVLLELGVLHYFVDLSPLFQVVYDLLKPGGSFLLRDYHPFVSKTLTFDEAGVRLDGNYFDRGLTDEEVAYGTLLPEEQRTTLSRVKLRKWTMGEIITAIAKSGLLITSLEEEKGVKWAFPNSAPPNLEGKLPGLYTLISRK